MKQKIFTTAADFREGDSDESIKNARLFLNRLGYIAPQQEAPVEAFMDFDSDLRVAVRKYQRFHSLEATGVLNEETRQMMEMPRCGVADLQEGEEIPESADFVASGGKWNTSHPLAYRFVNATSDLPENTQRDLVRQAFGVWANAAPKLVFNEVTGTAAAEFLISWVTGDHGDGNPFDGPGHVLAHAFFPPPVNPHPGIAGDLHFDDEETWGTTHGGGSIDLLTVAIHELGHALGLRHTNVQGAIMFPTYSGINHQLHTDDLNGIRSIYPDEVESWLARFLRWLRDLFR